MNKPLWQPSQKLKQDSVLQDFCHFINFKSFSNFKELWQWSVKNPEEFWSKFWDFSKIKCIKSNTKVKKSKKFFKNLSTYC